MLPGTNMETIFLQQGWLVGGSWNNIQTICVHLKNGKAAIGVAIFAQAPSPVQLESSCQQLDFYSGWPLATGTTKKLERRQERCTAPEGG